MPRLRLANMHAERINRLVTVQVGNGANMKLVVNMMMGTMMTTLAEGLALTDKAGLQQKQLLEVLGLGVMACPMYSMKVGCTGCTTLIVYHAM